MSTPKKTSHMPKHMPKVQSLSEAAILAVIDELVSNVSELTNATLIRPWGIGAISAASSGITAGHRNFSTFSAAARAIAFTTFHVKPLNFGNATLAAMLAHVLLTINGEEVDFQETVDLVSSEFNRET
ncbi:MAG: hypothetical protein Q4E11_06690 [Corynebacterium sp.]|uniref:hypothetical protein n=1 Tax=Corynebacterium sp. TaxID=1720 RepID=UPI0026DB575D|nr:hypothetical protein [Corynebacterium sp.]MDO5030259.1 hypothetical protein [Corynebacterium sp.]